MDSPQKKPKVKKRLSLGNLRRLSRSNSPRRLNVRGSKDNSPRSPFSPRRNSPRFQTKSKFSLTSNETCDSHVWSAELTKNENFVRCHLCQNDAPLPVIFTINRCDHDWIFNNDPRASITNHNWWKQYCRKCHISIV